MAKDIQTIKNQFQIIQNETIEDVNTANRVGGGFLTLKKNDITSASDAAIETIRNKGVTVRIIG